MIFRQRISLKALSDFFFKCHEYRHKIYYSYNGCQSAQTTKLGNLYASSAFTFDLWNIVQLTWNIFLSLKKKSLHIQPLD